MGKARGKRACVRRYSAAGRAADALAANAERAGTAISADTTPLAAGYAAARRPE